MGYTTTFEGHVSIEPPLSAKEVAYLQKFNETRRMNRTKGPYYVDNTGMAGQDLEPDIVDYNRPPEGQPGLWCQWTPSDDGTRIEWDGGEKFYHAAAWMEYLITHFLGRQQLAKKADESLKFFEPHVLNGEFQCQGEDSEDIWKLVVEDNRVTRKRGRVVYED